MRREYFLFRAGGTPSVAAFAPSPIKGWAVTVRSGMLWETCTGIASVTSKLERVFKFLEVSGSACLSLFVEEDASPLDI